ncbi:LacI family DNA-binding transcriptional regulator [Actinoplanes sp. OR16]|uniref:LacI family DNA-binding transcriptional regulator n=1 Tax=Actinoplanes sp. OR16 TaxID=946334 RepID=UPI000FD73168|nr:LacI family DNA-binding transcriptional regulator [Actinoplanes sp. OR16]
MEKRRPTLADVARVAGVSRATASRAINGAYGSSAETRDHVRRVAARLGFEPHPVAQALATGGRPGSVSQALAGGEGGRPGSRERIEILIVDPDPEALSAKPFYGRVMTGALRALGDAEISLSVRRVATPPVRDDDPPFGRLLINMPGAVGGRCRTVSLGRSAPGISYVAPDNHDGGLQAARHLIAGGRRRIGAVFGPATPCAEERKAGFLQGADAAVVSVDGDFTRGRAYAATWELLGRAPRLDAVFAACDVSAMGVLQALRESGRRVPDDVAVVGFDGSALAEAADLSSVYMPVEEEAAAAVRHLLDPGSPLAGRLPTALRVRGSS